MFTIASKNTFERWVYPTKFFMWY